MVLFNTVFINQVLKHLPKDPNAGQEETGIWRIMRYL